MSDEARALERIRELGGDVERDDEQPGKPIVKVDLSWKKLKDKDLEILTAFADLREVDLTEVRGITDAGLAGLREIKTVQVLDLGLTRIGDAALREIGGCRSLHRLNLWGTRITAAGLPALRACKQLRWCCVKPSRASMRFFPALDVLKQLGPTAAEMVPDVLAYVGRQKAFTNEEPHLVHIDPEGIQAVPGLICLLDSAQETVRYQVVCELEAYGPRAQAAVTALTTLANRAKGRKELTADADAARHALTVIQQAPDAEPPKSAMERALDLVKKAIEGE
jgi:hypothetical protein